MRRLAVKPTDRFKVMIILFLFAGCLLLYSPVLLAVEPTEGACPGNTLPFYRLRVEYTTSSDWSRLQIENPEGVLTARVMTLNGTPKWYNVRADGVSMGQELAAVKAGQRIGVTVDYALAAEGVHRPFSLHLQNGSLNESRVRLYIMVGDTAHFVKEIVHDVGVGEQSNGEPLRFLLDLNETTAAIACGMMHPTVREHLLWAFYYPWYHLGSWSQPELRDRPEKPYESGDPNMIVGHIEAARSAGIDGFVSSWWGPGSFTDRNLPLLLDLAQERAFLVSLYFETLTDSGARNAEEIFNWLAYAISRYGEHPAFMKINGKPLIVIWASDSVPLETWRRIFTKLRTQGLDAVYLSMGFGGQSLEVFDGVHDYSISESTISDLTKTYKLNSRVTRFYHLLADASTPKISVATVQPGYDERSIPGRKGAFRDREGGAFYRGTFEAALSSDPDWIFITTWNEWYENTHIEPSQLNGEKYLTITHEFAQKWKGQ
jgi:glycosyl hydrolase family 99